MTDFSTLSDSELDRWLAERMGYGGIHQLLDGTLKGMRPDTELPVYETINYTRDREAAMGLLDGRHWETERTAHGSYWCAIHGYGKAIVRHGDRLPRCIAEAVAAAMEKEGAK